MNKLARLFVLSSFLIFSLTACRNTESIGTAARLQKKSSKFLYKKLADNTIDFVWFSAKGKMKLERAEEQLTTTVNIRMKKDSLIWITVKKVNIEGARILLTPDLIQILDRQQSTYIRQPFSNIKDEFGLDITFSDLQDLILGNAILYQNNDKLVNGIEDKKNVLQTPANEKDVLKIFFENGTFRLSEIRGSKDNNAVSIKYGDYQKVASFYIPNDRIIELDSEEQGAAKIELNLSKIELNVPQKTKFTIPSSYQQLN